MDTLEFLQRVLPPEGFLVSLTINPGQGPRQGFHKDTTALAGNIEALSRANNNIYYAVASFADRGAGRKQDNVQLIKTLFIDVDVGPGKPFADWRDGLRAVGAFVLENNLPRPMIVSSGNGLHVYWVLDEPLTVGEWQPLADRLKALIPRQDERPIFDPARPADSASVLRPVGTTNPKGGRDVRLLLDAPPVPVSVMRDALGATEMPAVTVAAPVRSALLDAMAVKQDFPPSDPDVLTTKCAQIGWATQNQADVPEPMWYALLGIAAHCIDPEQTAISWSQGHPDYDEARTLRKLSQWKNSTTGPATCSRFEQERPSGCAKCKLRGKITTPARLGLQYQPVAVPDDAPDEISQAVKVPWPFKRTDSGMKVTIDGTDVDVCSFDIYPVSYGRDESLGYETVRYKWNRPHVGWKLLTFRQSLLAEFSVKDFAISVADQGIILPTKRQTELFQMMLRSYMEELRQLRSVTNLYSSMGWKNDNTEFLVGDTIYRRTANGSVEVEVVNLAAASQRSSDSMFGTAGTAEEWAKFTSVLERAVMPVHKFALCVSMASPLLQFTGLKGLTVSLYGPTGAGKSLAQMWQQSVWGDPTKLHYNAKFTQNALFSRIGFYNNLPVTVDETTMLPAKEVGDFLYWVSQGRDKARLSRAAEERDAKTWATFVTTSANRSMASMLAASGLETDAQMARLLEVVVPAHPLFTRSTDAGQKIYNFVSSNYGTVGRVLIQHYLEMGEEGIRLALEHHKGVFNKTYNSKFSGSERYWEQCILLADFAGKVATDLGLIQFDYRDGTAHILTQLGAMRKAVVENHSDSFDLLTEYLNDQSHTALTVTHVANPQQQVVDTSRLPRGEVHIRYDLFRANQGAPLHDGIIMIDRRHFKRWLAERGGDYRNVAQDMTGQNINVTPQSDKGYLGRGTNIKLGQQYVLSISVNHPRLVGILTNEDNRSLSAQLSVVQGGKP
jgi:hypothetical protein